jgi:uncharacterized DUF497 family protein
LIINDLLWDDKNIEHIAAHDVSPTEVEDICSGSNYCKKENRNRYLLRGQTAEGRYLMVVVEGIGAGVFRPITAFEMSEGYKSGYRKQQRGKK